MDLLIVPGGPGIRREIENPPLIEWIKSRAQECQHVVSVCTGALLLGATGLLAGQRVTTHWAAQDELARICPEATIMRDERFVDSGHVITAAGVAAGIDMALYLAARYLGEGTARRTARRMEYPYPY